MRLKDIYIAKSSSKEEIYRNMISIYYYKLFNPNADISSLVNKKHKLFFENYFLNYQNPLIFTLYNQIPTEFLPLPKQKFYYFFPVISFNKIGWEPKLNPHEKVENINEIWKYKVEKKMKNITTVQERFPSLKLIKNTSYDDVICSFIIKSLFSLPSEFIKNKLIMIRTDKESYVTKDFKIGSDSINVKGKIINQKDIINIILLKELTKEDVINCFNLTTIEPGTYLYHQLKIDKEYKDEWFWNYFCLNFYSRILNPFEKNILYKYQEYITIKPINILDISTNSIINNPITTNKKYSKFQCFDIDNIKKLNPICDYDLLDVRKRFDEINYNKKRGLLLLIWKNSTYIDYSMSFTEFLEHFNLPYFNLMSLVIDKDQPKLLGEEIYMNTYLEKKYLKVVTKFTTDTTKFKNKKINPEYEKIYF